MTDKPSVLRDTDDEARRLARRLIHTGPQMALAVIDPETGFPGVSRVLVATDGDGAPVILVSALSAHTKALGADPRCSLLAGEQAKGDPLAYPRITVLARAMRIERDDPARTRLRRRFVRRHPKAELYIDFPDFAFFRLEPVSASLNGGFGRAYALEAADLLNPATADAFDEDTLLSAIEAAGPDGASHIAAQAALPARTDWRICGLDSAGIDLVSADHLAGGRLEFESPQIFMETFSKYIARSPSTSRKI